MTRIMAEKILNLFSHTELKPFSVQRKAHEILLVCQLCCYSLRDFLTYPLVDTEQDVDKLIEKTQREAVQEKSGGSSLTFSFAKVWAANKDDLEEVVEDDQTDSWAQALQKLNEHRQMDHDRQLVESGRGARRRAADIAKASVRF
jgi:hypothetical protein